MKKIIMFLLVINLFGAVYFKGSHKTSITNLAIYGDYLVSVSSNSVVKLWDLKNRELLQSFKGNNGVVVLSKGEFLLFSGYSVYDYDLKTFKKLNDLYIYGSANNNNVFLVKQNKLFFSKKYAIADIDLDKFHYHELKNFDNKINFFDISKNSKYLLVGFNKRVEIYNLYGDLYTKFENIIGLNRGYFLDKDKIFLIINNSEVLVYDIKSSTLIFSKKIGDNLETYCAFNKNIFFVKNNKVYKFDIKTSLLTQVLSFHNQNKASYLNISKNYIVIGFSNGDFYVFKKDSNKNIDLHKQLYKVSEINSTKKSNNKLNKTTKLVSKKVDINEKLDLIVTSSVQEGYAPLKVDIFIKVNNLKLVFAYYMNLGGKEIMKKGSPPKKVSVRFYKAGVYPIIVALKSFNGKIVTKKLKIKVKEKNFNEFKKEMW